MNIVLPDGSGKELADGATVADVAASIGVGLAKAALAGVPEPPAPDARERIAMARRHARLLARREGKNIVRMRKHAMWYLAGLPGAAAARAKINACVSVEDFDRVFDELLAFLGGHEQEG